MFMSTTCVCKRCKKWMQPYLGKGNCDITPLLTSLERRAVTRTRTRMIARDKTPFSNSTEVVRIGACRLRMPIVSTEQTTKDHVALMSWMSLMMAPIALVISPLWFNHLRISPRCQTLFYNPSWQDICLRSCLQDWLNQSVEGICSSQVIETLLSGTSRLIELLMDKCQMSCLIFYLTNGPSETMDFRLEHYISFSVQSCIHQRSIGLSVIK